MKRRILAFCLCLSLMFSVLAVPAYAASACTCEGVSFREDGTEIHEKGCPLYEEPSCTCGDKLITNPNGTVTHAPGCPEYVTPVSSACTCGDELNSVGGHLPSCPLYEKVVREEEDEHDVATTQPGAQVPPTQPPFEFVGNNPAVNFTAVADFLPPVLGAPLRTRAMARAPLADSQNGLSLDKTAKYNEDGTYTITLEAYAEGEEYTIEVTKDIPTDIVLVLDESGTMEAPMEFSPNKHQLSTNSQNYTYFKNNGGGGSYPPLYYRDNRGNYWPYSIWKPNENDDRYEYGYWGPNGYVALFTSEGDNATPPGNRWNNNIVSGTFTDQFYPVQRTRMDVLKDTLNDFITQINTKANGADGVLGGGDDVNHRVAIVGFSENANNRTNGFQSMDTSNGRTVVNQAIQALTPTSTTSIDYGMQEAANIFANDTNTGITRNRVVIALTDGAPCRDTTGKYDPTIAGAAIRVADQIKELYKASVYSVGIFDGANANDAGNQSGTEVQKANWFMQNLSSNGGIPQNPSYYLSANDAAALEDIFQQIIENINQGGSESKLDEKAVVRDVISDQFELPENAQINLYTARFEGKQNGINQWATRLPFSDGTAVKSADGRTVSVSNFEYSENWCGDSNGKPHGKKLIIEFVVKPKDAFLGGNSVQTNNGANIYADVDSTESLGSFPVPDVNVPIKDITITAGEKNVYLLHDMTLDQIRDGVTVMVGTTPLTLTEAGAVVDSINSGHNTVSVVYSYKDADGNVIVLDDLKQMTADAKYDVTIKVSPVKNAQGDPNVKGPVAEEKTNNIVKNINVFLPALTFHDGEVYYGDNAPADYDVYRDALISWTHENADGTFTDSTAAVPAMIGTAPQASLFDITYEPDSGKIKNGKISTKDDFYVNVKQVKLGEFVIFDEGNANLNYVNFAHTACPSDSECGFLPSGGEFMLHVKTCQLRIKKNDGIDNEYYVFDVYKDGKKYTEISVNGNGEEIIYELPVGEYSIQENQDWSWRFDGSITPYSVDLSSSNDSGKLTCTNTPGNSHWLNGYSQRVTNTYGATSSAS